MISRRTWISATAAAGLVLSLAGLSAYAHYLLTLPKEEPDGWQPIAWPFPRDGWPPGKAWRGHDLEVYIRPKLGFCGNCDTGVVEDSEVDRVTDLDLFDENFTPLGDGGRIRITDMTGRARLYRLRMHGGERTALGIAVNYKCDLIVAIVLGNVADPATAKFVRQFLEADKVQYWVNQQLEGR
ncbi:MAG TPA: hypothetical protein VMI56_13490 [Reyranella sp.]|nr:hypothetical protein [Reyranella sp.]